MAMPQVGDTAPDFEIANEKGEMVKLSDYLGQRLVLYFYPKADTPGCTKQACAFRDNYSKFEEKGITVLGASIDTPQEQMDFKQKYNLPFTLLADPDHWLSDLYGIWGDHKVDYNGKTVEYTGLRRSTFIIDENGVVTYSAFGVDPTTNTAEILELV